jgi:hypothetical protein
LENLKICEIAKLAAAGGDGTVRKADFAAQCSALQPFIVASGRARYPQRQAACACPHFAFIA